MRLHFSPINTLLVIIAFGWLLLFAHNGLWAQFSGDDLTQSLACLPDGGQPSLLVDVVPSIGSAFLRCALPLVRLRSAAVPGSLLLLVGAQSRPAVAIHAPAVGLARGGISGADAGRLPRVVRRPLLQHGHSIRPALLRLLPGRVQPVPGCPRARARLGCASLGDPDRSIRVRAQCQGD